MAHSYIVGTLAVLFTASLTCSSIRAEDSVDVMHVPDGTDVAIIRKDGEITLKLVPKARSAAAAKPTRASSSRTSHEAVSALDSPASASTPDPFRQSLDVGLTKLPSLDRPISAVPAFTALDLSPESVSHPTNPRDFAASLLNGVDRKGVLQTGLALETTPFRFIPGWRQDYPHYNSDDLSGYWTRFFYNFSLSLATAKATADKDDESINLALGLQAILWQNKKNHPLRNTDLQQAFHANFDHVVNDIPANGPLIVPGSVADAQKNFQKAVEDFRAKQVDRHNLDRFYRADLAIEQRQGV